MELSLEAYRLIVKYVGNRADICTLCRVNKGFQRAAERALYNTIFASDTSDTLIMCSLLADQPRLAIMVEALTVFVGDESHSGSSIRSDLPENFWPTVARALQLTTRLRFLNLHLDYAGDTAQAWVLEQTTFRLRSFHCDLLWDIHLISFLNAQPDIDDLYIVDYRVPDNTPTSAVPSSSLDAGALPYLSTLECTFTEAAGALVPTRPISRLKTCFSKTHLREKREELSLLFTKLFQATHPLHSLDIADSSYSELFSMELLTAVVRLQNQVQGLQYLGTLVLPIGGQEVHGFVELRLQFYGLLRRLPYLQCVEVDVSEWEPPPPIPAGVRALASELRLYCPSVERVIFVNDFERTVITAVHGICESLTQSGSECILTGMTQYYVNGDPLPWVQTDSLEPQALDPIGQT
ncbi:hypothetical protein HYDPIDRAFT_177168 [Hydnomerulius pinastri MD-312]|uniref:F-box domain-containing protein n=1 Tax=Hydnomerulius pinastri MD-312 TaxID=994086 RepID=A0A0C9V657_9AGAM|nr:hypothetical protein HYDPIDRAFT_177168 [Hydnomerulius pinastri MD-312]